PVPTVHAHSSVALPLFFSSLSPPHCHLHSFPTRRSSDLFGSSRLGDAAETVDGGQGEQRLEGRGQTRGKPARQRRPEQERERGQDAARDRPEADRAEHREEREEHGKESTAERQTDVIT